MLCAYRFVLWVLEYLIMIKNNLLLLRHPIIILLPVLTVLGIYASNFGRLSISLFFTTAVTLILVLFCFSVLVGIFIKNPQTATLFVACIYTGVFYPGVVDSKISYLWFGLWLLIAILFLFKNSLREPMTFIIFTIAASSLVSLILNIGSLPLLLKRSEVSKEFLSGFSDNFTNESVSPKRDVYYIILDRYASNDQLKAVYEFDNSEFTNRLESFGFDVAKNSYSNYQRTAHSLTSSMNFSYLTQLEKSSVDWLPLYNKLKDSAIFHFFKGLDYQIHFMGSWWEVTRRNELADVDVNFKAWPELTRVVFERSVIGQFFISTENQFLDPRQIHCQRVFKKFDALQKLPLNYDSAAPRFVFAHFLVPHPPYVFDRDGNCMSVEKANSRTRAENYTEQIQYANTQLLKFLEVVNNAPKPKPIVIFQSDEGPWPEKYIRDEIHYLGRDVSWVEWGKTLPADLREKMGILNAVYFPGKTDFILPDDSSPVNNFRFVLNEYFGANLQLLENKSYIFPNNADLYRYDDVTEKLKEQ